MGRRIGALSACMLVGILGAVPQPDKTLLSLEKRQASVDDFIQESIETGRLFPHEIYRVAAEERRALGITDPVEVRICTRRDECSKEGTSYSVEYGDGPFMYVIYLQPRHFSRGVIRHEMWHIKHDYPATRNFSRMEFHVYYHQIGEPNAAAYGAGKTF